MEMRHKKIYLGLHAHPTRKIAFDYYQGDDPNYVERLASGTPAKLYVLESVAGFKTARPGTRFRRREGKAKLGAYMCWVPEREAPRYFHDTFSQAASEANRLLEIGNSRVLVMKVIKVVKSKCGGVKRAA